MTTPRHVPARTIAVPSSISPEAQAALAVDLATAPGSYPSTDDHDAWRALIAARLEAIAAMGIRGAGAGQQWSRFEVGGVPVYAAHPPDAADDDDRVLVTLHGGSLIYMGGDACGNSAVGDARRTGLPAWSVDYRMPPDHLYPCALDDCVTVYRALLDERPPRRIVVSGFSAGGNLAAATLLRARDEGLPMPAALVLMTPELDLTESGDSFGTNAGVDNVLASLMPINRLYAGGHALDDPYLSPVLGDHTGFPPTILTTGTRDLFLSNAVRMHRSLRRAGVEAELHVLEAAPHGAFLGMAPEDRELDAEIRSFVQRHCPREG